MEEWLIKQKSNAGCSPDTVQLQSSILYWINISFLIDKDPYLPLQFKSVQSLNLKSMQ